MEIIDTLNNLYGFKAVIYGLLIIIFVLFIFLIFTSKIFKNIFNEALKLLSIFLEK